MEEVKEIYISELVLLQFFSGKTSEKESEQIIKWIYSSEECLRQARDIYYIYYVAKHKQVEELVDADFAFQSIKKKLDKKKHKLRRATIYQLVQRIAVAIVIPLSIFTGYLLISNKANVHYVEVTSKRGMVTKTVLPDSTIVWLNSGSTLKYPSQFVYSERNVELEGEAYFDVQKNKEQRFIINKGRDLSISVLGTQFNVEAYPNDNNITTTLVEGSVKIEYKDIEGGKQHTYLVPSQKMEYDIASGKMTQQSVSVAQYIAWKEGKIIFENTKLKDALHMLGKHFNIDFVVKNDNLYSNAFTGKFEGERLDEILSLIQMTSNINYRYLKNNPLNEKRVIEIH